jgi:hypothetical protein
MFVGHGCRLPEEDPKSSNQDEEWGEMIDKWREVGHSGASWEMMNTQ